MWQLMIEWKTGGVTRQSYRCFDDMLETLKIALLLQAIIVVSEEEEDRQCTR